MPSQGVTHNNLLFVPRAPDVITVYFTLPIITATEARRKFDSLIERAVETREPIHIAGKRGNAVLVSEERWTAIQETLFLQSIPGMKESIVEGMNEPLSKCAKKPGW